MSSIKIQSNPNGTGQLILAAPDTNSTRTITLPDADVTLGAGAGTTEAWVNFNGTGTVAIRADGNVSSITDYGVGNYGVNFLNSMPSVYYSAPRIPDYDGVTGTGLVVTSEVLSATASSIRVTSSAPNGTLYDCVRFDMTVTA